MAGSVFSAAYSTAELLGLGMGANDAKYERDQPTQLGFRRCWRQAPRRVADARDTTVAVYRDVYRWRTA